MGILTVSPLDLFWAPSHTCLSIWETLLTLSTQHWICHWVRAHGYLRYHLQEPEIDKGPRVFGSSLEGEAILFGHACTSKEHGCPERCLALGGWKPCYLNSTLVLFHATCIIPSHDTLQSSLSLLCRTAIHQMAGCQHCPLQIHTMVYTYLGQCQWLQEEAGFSISPIPISKGVGPGAWPGRRHSSSISPWGLTLENRESIRNSPGGAGRDHFFSLLPLHSLPTFLFINKDESKCELETIRHGKSQK